MRAKIRKTLTRTGETITDLHVWQNDTDHLSAIVADKTYARGEPILRMTGVDGQHASAGFALP